MKNILRASVAVVVVAFTVTLIICLIDSIGSDYSPLLSFVIAGVAAVVAAVVTLVWAVPLHLILQKYKQEKLSWYLFLAVVPSVIFIYGFKPFGEDTTSDLAKQAAFCALVGSLGAFIFWYIAVRKPHTYSRPT